MTVVLLACGHPRFSYPAPSEIGVLAVDEQAFAPFARALRSDLERGPGTRDRLFTLAILDALDERWADATALLDRVAAMTTDPGEKLMTGLTIRVWADAIAHDGNFRAALERKLDALPIERLRAGLTMLAAMGAAFTPDVCRKLLDDAIGPRRRVGFDDAQAIVFQRWAVERLAPVGKDLVDALAARGISPGD